MVFEKMNKKGTMTLTGLIMSMLLIITMFTGFFLYINQQADVAGVSIDSRYQDTSTRLSGSQSSISNRVNSINDNLKEIQEADNVYQVAWNGLKGLGNTLKLPISFVEDATNMLDAVLISTDEIPGWVKALAITAVITFVVLLVLALLKGESKL